MSKHKCSNCNKVEEWGEGWSWYGSYRDIDDNVPVIKTCSEECKRASQ